MKTYPHPNVHISLYEGDKDLSFDCPGRCKFELCANKPPAPEDRCAWEINSSCSLQIARIAALKAVQRYCNREIHILEDEIREIEENW